jgi:diamine N-acetyltransferase
MISRLLFASSEPKVIGFAMYYFTYDPWTGKLLYLEDFFVVEEFRGKAGQALSYNSPTLRPYSRSVVFVKCLTIYFVLVSLRKRHRF